MKTLVPPAFLLSLLVFACQKDETDAAFIGQYFGPMTSHSSQFKEVFTSPTESHFEWVYDSSFKNPDTLRLSKISTDSFAIEGGAAQQVPSEWRRFAFAENTGPTIFEFERGASLPGYFSRSFRLKINTETGTAKFTYLSDYQVPISKTDVMFEGKK